MKSRINKTIDIINSISGEYSQHQVFSDWVCMMAISIANMCTIHHDSVYEDRERKYELVADKYPEGAIDKFAEAMALLIEEMKQPRDLLGEIYMLGGFGSKMTGQFFTPYHLSELTAMIVFDKMQRCEDGKFHAHEPSCGGGGMIIALATEMKRCGINYQRELEVVAQDLDWNCVYMCYVQLSLMGISAVVVQGDTLTEPYSVKTEEARKLYTPKKRGLLL